MNNMKLVFATNNKNKLAEIAAIVPEGIEVNGLTDIGCNEDIPETAETLEGNAQIKSKWVWEKYGYNCFSDDTGLEIEALSGAPGVYSARYAGAQKSAEDNMALVLSKLEGTANRKARFRTVVSLIIDGVETQFEGVVNGEIALSYSGNKGFGYDPIFIPEGHSRSFAAMNQDEKNSMSHRGRAVQKLIEFLNKR